MNRQIQLPRNTQTLARFDKATASVESLSFADISEHIKGWMPGVVQSIQALFVDKDPVKPLPILGKGTNSVSEFLKRTKSLQHTSVRSTRISRPQGLQSTYIDLLEDVLPACQEVAKIRQELILPFTSFVAGLVSAPMARMEKIDFEVNGKKLAHLTAMREARLEKIGQHFQTNIDPEPTQIYEKLVERSSDWEKIIDLYTKCETAVNSVNTEQLRTDIKHICELLDALHANLKKQNSDDGFSSQAAQALSRSVLEMANQVEYYAVMHFRVLNIEGALEKNIEEIKRLTTPGK